MSIYKKHMQIIYILTKILHINVSSVFITKKTDTLFYFIIDTFFTKT